MAPLIKKVKEYPDLKPIICVFRQHRTTLDQVLDEFGIKPDFDFGISISDKQFLGKGLSVFLKAKSLFSTAFGLLNFIRLLKREKPNLLIVQGDTSTVFLAAFIAFHFKIKIAHIEAGLRTHDKYAPFPEEMNRQLLARLADFHFAATESARQNLLNEGIRENIWVTGNTVIDAVRIIIERGNKNDFFL